MIIKGTLDEKYFDYRKRRKLHKNFMFRIYYGGRNLGKTTRVIWTEYQDIIAEFNRHKDPLKIQPVIHIIRSEKTWQKIKGNFLNNLKQPPFNIPFMIEGTKIWYIEKYEKQAKNGEVKEKIKKLCVLGWVIFLWSANDYKQSNLENYKCLIMDEIIPEIDGYIPREIEKFDTLLSTFTRLRNDKYVIGICNNITNSSPYFQKYGVGADNLPEPGECFVNLENKVLIEYVQSPEFINDLQAKSTAGILQKGQRYGAFAMGGQLLQDENYQILTKPKGHYTPNYNVWLKGESYILNQYSKTAYFIYKGNLPHIRNYYLDKQSALKNSEPYSYLPPDSLVNDYKIKLSKGRLWFKDSEIREEFLDFFKKY